MKFDLLLLGQYVPNDLLKITTEIESYGFKHLWYADEKFYRDPYCSLTFVAQHTKKIKLGTCVTDPITRHPAITAMSMATMDECSNGRGVLGIGAGFTGIAEMGIDAGKIIPTLRESIDIIRKLWSGDVVFHEGDNVFFQNGKLDFEARKDIQIMLASSSPKILKLSGEIGDIQMLGALASQNVINIAKGHIHEGALLSGKDISSLNIIPRVNLIIGDDISGAKKLMKPLVIRDLCRTYPRWNVLLNYSPDWELIFRPLISEFESININPRNINDNKFFNKFSYLVTDEMIRDKALAGNINSITDQIAEISSIGINEIALFPLPLPNQTIFQVLNDFYKKIMPEFTA